MEPEGSTQGNSLRSARGAGERRVTLFDASKPSRLSAESAVSFAECVTETPTRATQRGTGTVTVRRPSRRRSDRGNVHERNGLGVRNLDDLSSQRIEALVVSGDSNDAPSQSSSFTMSRARRLPPGIGTTGVLPTNGAGFRARRRACRPTPDRVSRPVLAKQRTASPPPSSRPRSSTGSARLVPPCSTRIPGG